jgi:hypothetical protein
MILHVGCHVLGQIFLSRHNMDRLNYDISFSVHDPVIDDCKCMQHEQFFTTHFILLPLRLVQGELNVFKFLLVCMFIILFHWVLFSNVINSCFVFRDVVDIFFIHAAYRLWFEQLHLHPAYFCKFMVVVQNGLSIWQVTDSRGPIYCKLLAVA